MKLSRLFNNKALGSIGKGLALGLGMSIMLFPGVRIGHDLTKKGGEKLTDDEIALVQSIFGDEVKTKNVRKHFHEETQKTAAAWVQAGSHRHVEFWGNRYHSSDYAHDYRSWRFGLFVHEMTHIWQNQNQPHLLHLIKHKGVYDYDLDETSRFKDFSIEQQASIVEDYAEAFLFTDHDRYYDSHRSYYKPHLKRVVEDQFPQARNTRLALDQKYRDRYEKRTQTPRPDGQYPRGIKAVPGV